MKQRWCPKGVRPPWIVREAYQWLWLYAAVEPRQGRLFCLLMPAVDSACFEAFLGAFEKEFKEGERVGLVLDNGPSHTSGQVKWPEGVVPIRLPAYSPELNPAEQLFRMLRKPLSNRVFEDLGELEEALREALQNYWEQPDVLIRLTDYPWWHDASLRLPPLSP